MQKIFYTSGFLYDPDTHEILLQQKNHGDDVRFTLFRGKCTDGNDPRIVFQECIQEALGVPVDSSSIVPVYDYIHEQLGEHYVFFIEVTENFSLPDDADSVSVWIPLAKLSKYRMSEQTRHDIVIGERVIRHIAESQAS